MVGLLKKDTVTLKRLMVKLVTVLKYLMRLLMKI